MATRTTAETLKAVHKVVTAVFLAGDERVLVFGCNSLIAADT